MQIQFYIAMYVTKINEWTVRKFIGEGGFAKVFKVLSPTNEIWAIKLVAVVDKIIQSAIRQAEIYSSQKHKNVLKAKEYFFWRKQKYLAIVLPYCEGGSLYSVIGKVTQDKVIKHIMLSIIEGLIDLHERQNIVHRDIKPGNILLLDGVVKIADFGIAKLMNQSGLKSIIGTDYYIAPETLKMKKYGFKVDIWALGIVFLELLLGKRITQLVPLEQNQYLCMKHGFPYSNLLDQIKQYRLKILVTMMLSKDPQKRPTVRKVYEFLTENADDKKNNISDLSEPELIQALNNLTDSSLIEIIYQPSQNIKDDGIKALALVQQPFKNLKIIDLNSNQITDVGLQIFSKSGKMFPKLRQVDFTLNRITSDGFRMFIRRFNRFIHLKVILFNENKIDNDGLKALAQYSFKLKLSNLEELWLNKNDFTDQGFLTFTTDGGSYNGLKIIHFSDNHFSKIGLDSLVQKQKNFPDLRRIYLKGTQISKDERSVAYKKVKKRFKIHV